MLKKFGRLFVIKTRWEAWLVTYAIALGAVERGKTYLANYPGGWGLALFFACLGVVFLAGAKLLDSVRPAEPRIVEGPHPALARHAASPARRHVSDIQRTGSRRQRAASRR
ncbi:hypothetical protein [Sphingomicrobium nitratireducens]|uniref:hypothetical protein n=1 Tax=Sphingomicrobium nitratireducens TaxID=2964666 RepID=UPI00223F65AF|nr:hypothetical protein [Sphingomicrobium nitratireducens]